MNLVFLCSPPLAPDRLGRLIRHILKQRSLYPLYPAHESMLVVMEKLEVYTYLPFKPHLLVIPSDLRYFARVRFLCLLQLKCLADCYFNIFTLSLANIPYILPQILDVCLLLKKKVSCFITNERFSVSWKAKEHVLLQHKSFLKCFHFVISFYPIVHLFIYYSELKSIVL